MKRRYHSVFQYELTRPYPFRWFTPVTVIGGLIFLALFSALNFFANGYELKNQSTADPLGLEAEWKFRVPAFIANKVQPQCDPVEIPIASTVFTNQTALTYNVISVSQNMDGLTWNASSSLRYYNSVFDNCAVNALTITLEGHGQTPQQRAWNQWAPTARAFITCNITNPSDAIFRTVNTESRASINMTTYYSYVPEDITTPPTFGPTSAGLFQMTYQDPQSRASMWWGASLMSAFWVQVSEKMTEAANANQNAALSKGIIYFTRNKQITDITSLDFFNIDYRFFEDKSDGSSQLLTPNDTSNNFSPHSISNFDSHQTFPNIWVPADSYAKSFYSTILTDLGQVSSPANILVDEKALTYFSANMSSIVSDVAKSPSNAIPGPGTQSFADQQKSTKPTGPLTITPTRLMGQFLCQVPVLRSRFSIFVSVLVQDLVMLNAVWVTYTVVVQAFFLTEKRFGPEIRHCMGCAPTTVSDIANIIAHQPPGSGRGRGGNDDDDDSDSDAPYKPSMAVRTRARGLSGARTGAYDTTPQLPPLPDESTAASDFDMPIGRPATKDEKWHARSSYRSVRSVSVGEEEEAYSDDVRRRTVGSREVRRASPDGALQHGGDIGLGVRTPSQAASPLLHF